MLQGRKSESEREAAAQGIAWTCIDDGNKIKEFDSSLDGQAGISLPELERILP